MRSTLVLLALSVALAAAPPPERAFAELKVYDAGGSPLRKPVNDWAGARERVRTDAAWAEWLKERRLETEQWMATQRDHVEWVAGWWHDFVSPKDGSFLIWTPQPPGEETLASPSDPRVKLTPKLFNAWVFGFRTRHASRMEEAARLYRLTGEERYARWVVEQLDFYAENYPRWPLQTSHNKARLMHQSLDDATVLTQHLRAARLLQEYVSNERRKAWFDKLFRPEAELLNESLQRVHNIGCWQRAATAQAALYGGDEGLWKGAIDGEYGVRRQVRDGVTGDSLWFEQSLGYNAYVMAALLPLFETAAEAGRMDTLRGEMAVIENLMLAPIMIRFPSGQAPNPADSTGGPQRVPNTGLLASAYRLFPTPLGLAAAAKLRNWNTLLDPPVPVAARPLPEVQSANLEASRMAILRQGPWQVYFHYGQLDSSHAQNEALNFEAAYGTTDLTHDPGTVGYGSPLHREYYTRGVAHNVPLVDGEGQARWARGELISYAPAEVAARQPAYRPGVTAERRLKLEDGALVDRVTVRTSDGREHRLGLMLHVQGEIEPPDGFQADPERFAQGYPAGFTQWSGVRSGRARTLTVRYGAERFAVECAAGAELRMAIGTLPDVPPRKRQAVYVELNGTEAAFTATIRPLR